MVHFQGERLFAIGRHEVVPDYLHQVLDKDLLPQLLLLRLRVAFT